MRKHGRVDANQEAIVDALRAIGVSVFVTSDLGNGFFDVIAGYRGRTFGLEIKDGRKPLSRRQLTEDEQRFRANWSGQWHIVNSAEEAVRYAERIGL